MGSLNQTDMLNGQPGGRPNIKAARSGKDLPQSAPASQANQSGKAVNQAATNVMSEIHKQRVAQSEGAAGQISSENEQTPEDMLASAVTQLNDYVQNEQRTIEFIVDEEAGLTVIRVTDRESGELIRQLPGDEIISLARKLNEQNTFNLFSAKV